MPYTCVHRWGGSSEGTDPAVLCSAPHSLQPQQPPRPYPVESYPVPGAPVEASSHLVPDNRLLRPAPFVSHINLNRGLVCLGSKLSETCT